MYLEYIFKIVMKRPLSCYGIVICIVWECIGTSILGFQHGSCGRKIPIIPWLWNPSPQPGLNCRQRRLPAGSLQSDFWFSSKCAAGQWSQELGAPVILKPRSIYSGAVVGVGSLEVLYPFLILEKSLRIAGTFFFGATSSGGALLPIVLSYFAIPIWLCWDRLEGVGWRPQECQEQ